MSQSLLNPVSLATWQLTPSPHKQLVACPHRQLTINSPHPHFARKEASHFPSQRSTVSQHDSRVQCRYKHQRSNLGPSSFFNLSPCRRRASHQSRQLSVDFSRCLGMSSTFATSGKAKAGEAVIEVAVYSFVSRYRCTNVSDYWKATIQNQAKLFPKQRCMNTWNRGV